VFDLTGLPGERLVQAGLSDLAEGRLTPAALAVSMASERFRQLGIELRDPLGVAPNRQM